MTRNMIILVSVLQSKNIEWKVGLKSKTQPFVAYKQSNLLTNIGLVAKGGKKSSK
jgi:hypothetical protein